MRKTLSTLAFVLLIMGFASSQVILREVIRLRDTLKVDKHLPVSAFLTIEKLSMAAGHHRFKEPEKAEKLRTQGIAEVELVYSDYPVGDDFSELNRKRILELYKYVPNAFNDKNIKWRVVVQTGVEKTGNIHGYFHGFVLYYRPYDLSTELSTINDVLEGKSVISDSTILKTMARNPHWKEMLVIADVTGSMTPYTAQLILWLKLNTKDNRTKQFTFFNDGDRKSGRKEVGKTGGIYSISSNNYQKVAEKAIEAMKNGSGGDMEENDIEAVLQGIKNCQECKNIVLIADNFAPVRDVELLKQVKKPIKIILCGTAMGINTQYLDIARATGGSVHTMESDLDALIKKNEGDLIELDGIQYRIVKGKFVQVKST